MKNLICLLFHWNWKYRTYSSVTTPEGKTVERYRCDRDGLWWNVNSFRGRKS